MYEAHRGWSLTGMYDSLRLLNPPGSFSETTILYTNVYPSLQLFIYLWSCVNFHRSLLFPAVFLLESCSLLKDACGFLTAPRPPPHQHAMILWLAHEGLFEASLYLLKHLRQHQRPHVTGGQSSNGGHCDSCILSLLSLLRRSAAVRGGWGAAGRRQEEEAPSLPRLCPSCVMAVLGFHVLFGWVSCSSSLRFLAENPCPSEAGDAPSSASISAQLRVAALCSHLPDTSSSAYTSPLHGLSWLTGSCLDGFWVNTTSNTVTIGTSEI